MPDSDKQEGISMKMLMLQVRKKPAKKLFDSEKIDLSQPPASKETELKKPAVRKKEKAVKG